MSFLTLTDIAGFEANVSDGWKADTSLPLVGWRLCADYGPSDLHPGTGRFDPDLTHGAGTKRQFSSTSSAWSPPVRRNANTQAACASRERRFWRHSAQPLPPDRAPPGSRNLCSILSSGPARPALLSIISGAPEDLAGGRP